MRRFNVFWVLLLQIILFAKSAVSQMRAFTVDMNDLLRNQGMLFDYGFAMPTKQCPEIRYTLDSMPFFIVPCFDKSSQELDVTLKVGNVDLGQAKGTFDTEVVISFDHGQLLNGEHRYYLKDNYLWMHYDTTLFGRKQSGDKKLSPVPAGFISSEDASKPSSQGDAPKPKRKEDTPKPRSTEDAPKPKTKKDAPKSKPKKDASKSKSRYDI